MLEQSLGMFVRYGSIRDAMDHKDGTVDVLQGGRRLISRYRDRRVTEECTYANDTECIKVHIEECKNVFFQVEHIRVSSKFYSVFA